MVILQEQTNKSMEWESVEVDLYTQDQLIFVKGTRTTQ